MKYLLLIGGFLLSSHLMASAFYDPMQPPAGAKLIQVQPHGVRLLSKGKIIDLDLKSRYKSIKKSVGVNNS